jgi:hypothetical protein
LTVLANNKQEKTNTAAEVLLVSGARIEPTDGALLQSVSTEGFKNKKLARTLFLFLTVRP